MKAAFHANGAVSAAGVMPSYWKDFSAEKNKSISSPKSGVFSICVVLKKKRSHSVFCGLCSLRFGASRAGGGAESPFQCNSQHFVLLLLEVNRQERLSDSVKG